jgi:putative transposase
LAISDAHGGLKAAIATVLGCAWQRCTAHFLRDCFGHGFWREEGTFSGGWRPNPGAHETVNVPYDIGGHRLE